MESIKAREGAPAKADRLVRTAYERKAAEAAPEHLLNLVEALDAGRDEPLRKTG